MTSTSAAHIFRDVVALTSCLVCCGLLLRSRRRHGVKGLARPLPSVAMAFLALYAGYLLAVAVLHVLRA